MADLSGVVLDAEGAPVARAQVSARLVDPGTGRPVTGWTSSGTITRGKTISVTTDDNGAWTLDLVPNDDITPEGSGWGIVQDGRPQVIVTKGAGSETMSTVSVLDDSALPATPAAISQAITSGQVPSPAQVAAKVAKAGDTMTGNLAFGGNKATGLGAPSASSDAARKQDVDDARSAAVLRDGSQALTADLPAGGNKLTGLGEPAAVDEAARLDEIAKVIRGDWSQELAQWFRAYASGTATAVVIGDSHSEPIITPELWTSWVPKLELRIAAREGTRGQPTDTPHSGWEGIAANESQWTHDGTEDGSVGPGGWGVSLTGSQTATRTDRECDGIELWFAQGGTALVSVDGGPADTVDTSAGPVSWSSGALTWGEHDVVVSVDSGTVNLAGSYFHAGTLGGIIVHNGGHGGSSIADHLAGGDYSGTIAHITAVQPDLVVIANGLVDHDTTGDYPAHLEAAVQEVQAAAPDASVLIVVEYEPDAPGWAGSWSAVAPAAARRVARTYGCAVVDHCRGIGAPPPPELFEGASIFPPANGTTSDGVHLNERGMNLAADRVAELVIPAGMPVLMAPRAATEAALGQIATNTIPSSGGDTTGVVRRTTAGAIVAGRVAGDTHDRIEVGIGAFDLPGVGFGPGTSGVDSFLFRIGTSRLRMANLAGVLGTIEVATPTAGDQVANKTYTDQRATDRLWIPADDFAGLTVADRGTAGRAATLAADTDYNVRYSVDLPAHWTAFNVVYVYEAADATAGNIYLRLIYQQHPNGGGAIPAATTVGNVFAAPGHTNLAEATVAGSVAITGRRIDLRAYLNRANAADTYTGVVYLRGLALVAA